ncbi:hypothetical protein LT493_38995, partial [Streptomyces tricolor]|nr:hypothetical protein [Streptomyces tricolor]
MSTTAELLKGAAELFPDEVVTQAHVRHLDLLKRRTKNAKAFHDKMRKHRRLQTESRLNTQIKNERSTP